ncbi:MAG: Integral rane protein TerC [bacterium]|nr:Integral rane protein TerC [bacterium]
MWSGFIAVVVALIAVDLLAHRHSDRGLTPRRALLWSALWIGVAIAFGGFVWAQRGADDAAAFFTGYVIEKSLSIDNLFVFLLLFREFRVPVGQQHRVLTWGIFGALVFRAVLIVVGIDLIHHVHAVLYAFGAFLLYTGVRTMLPSKEARAVGDGWVVRLFRQFVPLAPVYEGGRFFVRRDGKRVGTLLLLVLLVIEVSDIFFAVDSIPAIFAISDDPFIVFSSNILAVLGLRALYFATVDLLGRLRFLHFGLGTILVVVGAKMITADLVTVSPLISLAVTLGILAVTIIASLLAPAPAPVRRPAGEST